MPCEPAADAVTPAQSNSPDAFMVLLGVLDAVADGLAEPDAEPEADGLALGLADGLRKRVPDGAGTGTVGSPARSTGADSAWTPITMPTSTATTPTIRAIRPQFGPSRLTSGPSTESP